MQGKTTQADPSLSDLLEAATTLGAWQQQLLGEALRQASKRERQRKRSSQMARNAVALDPRPERCRP